LQFRYRGSRRESAVAQLFSLGGLHHMQERPKFCGLNITRSIQDRVFLGFMGLLFMFPTGYVLYEHHVTTSSEDMSLGWRLLAIFIDEVVLTIFLLAACCFVWGVAAPRWIERFFEKTISKFIMVLALISFILLGLVIYIFSVGV
jgi:hypothetical protein